MKIKEIEPHEFFDIMKKKEKTHNFTPIVLYGETGSGKSLLCEKARVHFNSSIDESYKLYFMKTSGLNLQKNIKYYINHICDYVADKRTIVYSCCNLDFATNFSKRFGLELYSINECITKRGKREYILGLADAFNFENKPKDTIPMVGDKILDLKISRLKNKTVYAVVTHARGNKFKCKELNAEDASHYPHNFYSFEQGASWDFIS